MKTNFLFLLLFFAGLTAISAQDLETNDSFIFLIFEIEQNKSSELEAKILSSQLVEKRLKTPTKSQDISRAKEYICIQLLSDDGTVLDCVNYVDPLTEHLEYVKENGRLGHTHHKREKNAFVLRRAITSETSQVKILHFKDDKSQLLNTSKIF